MTRKCLNRQLPFENKEQNSHRLSPPEKKLINRHKKILRFSFSVDRC